jgi:hypothetical protein
MATRFSDLVVNASAILIEQKNYKPRSVSPLINLGYNLEITERGDGGYCIVSDIHDRTSSRNKTVVDDRYGVEIAMTLELLPCYGNLFKLVEDVYIDTQTLSGLKEGLSRNDKEGLVYEMSVHPNGVCKECDECKMAITLILIDGEMHIRKFEMAISRQAGDHFYRRFAKYTRQLRLPAIPCQ